jgi:uncharacterized membrane protein
MGETVSDLPDPRLYAAVSLVIAVFMSAYGYARKSLNRSGAVAAVLVGFITFYSGFVFGFVLIAFFLTSSRITKIKAEEKKRFEEDYKEGGQRTATQVFCNSAPALVYAVVRSRRDRACTHARRRPTVGG